MANTVGAYAKVYIYGPSSSYTGERIHCAMPSDGHAAILVCNGHEEVYVSLWPKVHEFCIQKEDHIHTRIEDRDMYTKEINGKIKKCWKSIRVDDLHIPEMFSYAKEIYANPPDWSLEENCALPVLRILERGGLKNHYRSRVTVSRALVIAGLGVAVLSMVGFYGYYSLRNGQSITDAEEQFSVGHKKAGNLIDLARRALRLNSATGEAEMVTVDVANNLIDEAVYTLGDHLPEIYTNFEKQRRYLLLSSSLAALGGAGISGLGAYTACGVHNTVTPRTVRNLIEKHREANNPERTTFTKTIIASTLGLGACASFFLIKGGWKWRSL